MISSSDYQQIKDAFNEAVGLAEHERRELLRKKFDGNEALVSEVNKMLVFADGETSSDQLEHNAFEMFSNGELSNIPETIGNYKIIREIGRGGMGAVYEATRETENFKQRAAIKVIKRGMDTDAILSRFRHEQQILSSLEHPNIARFLDGGMTADGLPFYAMEFVDGESIDTYCEKNGLSVNDKLRLFCEVCSAVSFAHQNLVIHRDLKPPNILVTNDGTPKLLDFGIGKILTPDGSEDPGTATVLGMMTPAYASPEQIRGERIGTASDVYSLGVILFELLTGERPYNLTSKSQIEIERVILETEPTRPSTVRRATATLSNIRIDKDLDNIILKALKKNASERYSSVPELAADIGRNLNGMPVLARPLTTSYRASRFFRRNKVSVIAASAVFIALLIGAAVAIRQAAIAEAERARAEHRFNEVRELANNVIFKYHDAISALPGSTAARGMLVADALKYLDRLSNDAVGNVELQCEVAAAYTKLGDVQGKQYEANTGDKAVAVESYQKAIDLLENVVANDKARTQAKIQLVGAYESLHAIYTQIADQDVKDALLAKAVTVQNELAAAEPDKFEYQIQKVSLLIRRADSTLGRQNALDLHLEALRAAQALVPKTPGEIDSLNTMLMRLYQRIGSDHIYLGDAAAANNEDTAEFYRSAVTYHQMSLDLAANLYSADKNNLPNRRRYAVSLLNMAETLAKNKQPSEDRMNAAFGLFEQTVREDSHNVEAKFDLAEANRIRADIKILSGEKKEAVRYLETAIALYQKLWHDDPKDVESETALKAARKKISGLRTP